MTPLRSLSSIVGDKPAAIVTNIVVYDPTHRALLRGHETGTHPVLSSTKSAADAIVSRPFRTRTEGRSGPTIVTSSKLVHPSHEFFKIPWLAAYRQPRSTVRLRICKAGTWPGSGDARRNYVVSSRHEGKAVLYSACQFSTLQRVRGNTNNKVISAV